MKVLQILALLILSLPAAAQFRCAADEAPGNRPTAEWWQAQQQRHSGGPSLQKGIGANVVIPVVYHVLYHDAAQNIPDSSLLANLRVLNRDFAHLNADTAQIPAVFRTLSAGLNVQFCLAAKDPSGNPTSGIVRKYTDSTGFNNIYSPYTSATGGANLWPAASYVNIIVSNMTGGTYGFGTYPSNPTYQGIAVHYPYVGEYVVGSGRLMTHEMGHYFFLYHMWGSGACGSDSVQDTPPQQGQTLVLPTDPCPAFPHISCSNGPNGDNFYDYMDYSLCASMFTQGQVARMQNALTNMRSSLMSSAAGCHPTAVSGVPVITGPRIFPNPASGSFNVSGAGDEYQTLELIDLMGRVVLRNSINRDCHIQAPQSGLYLYRLSGKGGMLQGRLLVY